MNVDTGIYKISSPSGKCYIGSAVSFRRRWKNHLSDLRKGKHHSPALQSAYMKYGEAFIKFEKIALCMITDLITIEQRFIDKFHPEYNCSPTAGSTLGTTVSEETRQKISLANKGKVHSPETIARVSAANRGRKRSEEFCKNLGDRKRGSAIPQETRAKISESLRGERNPNFGKSLTSDHQERLLAGIRKAVLCVETGIIFQSGKDATDWLRCNGHPTARNSHISSACNGKLNRAYSYAWRFA